LSLPLWPLSELLLQQRLRPRSQLLLRLLRLALMPPLHLLVVDVDMVAVDMVAVDMAVADMVAVDMAAVDTDMDVDGAMVVAVRSFNLSNFFN
jgi:hypothetical protein